MIPGIVLVWLGIVFCITWMWDMVGKVPFLEHAIVFLMVFIDIVMDPGSMIVVGLFCTLILKVKREAADPPCKLVLSPGPDGDAGDLGACS